MNQTVLKTRILFVCTGNICRSPTAEAVARQRARAAGWAERFEFDSAGIQGYHAGEAPDPRTCKAAAKRGYDLSALRARKLEVADFSRFDLLLAMDRGHLADLRRQAAPVYQRRTALFLDFAKDLALDEVPDPYYGGAQGFEDVLDLCEAGVEGLFAALLAGREGDAERQKQRS